jgi:branched-chain amino acid transport system ATP-binding protein
MVNGQVIASGAPADVRANADVQAAYLGEEH